MTRASADAVAPPLKAKTGATPPASPTRRETARVAPGGKGDDARHRGSTTILSTYQNRDSDAMGELQHAKRAPSWLTMYWRNVRRRYAFWGRYSVGKLQAFSDYQHAHSLLRMLGVLALTPVPSLVALIALLALPLEPPTRGAAHQSVAFFRSFVSHIGASFGITLVVKQALEFSDRVYPYWRCLLLAVLASGTNEAIWTAVAFYWRFPIPFREVLVATTWFFWFGCYHYVTMRSQFALKRRRLRLYVPVFTVQFGMFYAFLGVAVVFAYVGLAGQVLIVLCVPPIKVMIKRLSWRLAKELHDLSTDVTVCVVEISAAMYQCLVLQYAASPLIPVLFFIVDVLQAAVEISLVLDHSFLVRGETAMAVAVDIIAHARVVEAKRIAQRQAFDAASGQSTSPAKQVTPGNEGGKRSVASMASPVLASASSARPSSNALVKLAEAAVKGTAAASTPQFHDFRPGGPHVAASEDEPNAHIVDGLPIPRLADAHLLTQLLRLLFATEMLLFIEFLEVVLALLYLVIFGLAYVLPGGAYIVSLMHLSHEDFATAMGNAVLYLVLELASFALVFWLLHRQCGLSTLYQIAYVLESYWMTIQGKVVACLLLLLNLATAHQGTDFSFQFVNYNDP